MVEARPAYPILVVLRDGRVFAYASDGDPAAILDDLRANGVETADILRTVHASHLRFVRQPA
jgi:hypothetical protein